MFVWPVLRIIQYPVRRSSPTVTGSFAIPVAGGTFRYRSDGVFCPPAALTRSVAPGGVTSGWFPGIIERLLPSWSTS